MLDKRLRKEDVGNKIEEKYGFLVVRQKEDLVLKKVNMPKC